jgi:hypothetical protein
MSWAQRRDSLSLPDVARYAFVGIGAVVDSQKGPRASRLSGLQQPSRPLQCHGGEALRQLRRFWFYL